MYPIKPQQESEENPETQNPVESMPEKKEPRSVLTFRTSAPGEERFSQRWQIGIDKQRVGAYVGLALLAGFVFGYVTMRFMNKSEDQKPALQSGTLAPAQTRPPQREPSPAVSTEFHRVSRVLKADTLEVEGVGNVRLIGVEAPEANTQNEAYAVQARNALAFTEKSLAGQDVRLEFDPAFTDKDNKDLSGNTMAYVYTTTGLLFNAELLKQGYAFVRSSETFRLAEDFRSYEREAMTTTRGLWGDSTSAKANPAAPSTTAPAPGTETTTKRPKLSPLSPNDIGPNLPGVVGSTGTTMTPSPVTSPAEPMVIATADRIYHKKGCELATGKKTVMGLSQARAAGYTACSRCFPSASIKM